MKFSILTLFPEFFKSPLNESLIKKAVEKNLLEIKTINLRDFSDLPSKQVDDSPYGGGAGMVLKADVLAKATKATKTKNSLVILTDPSGRKFNQKLAYELSKRDNLVIVCGRYEGVDQRFKDKYVDLEISLGDFVLNGGEVAALAILETVSRLKPGVLGNSKSLKTESFEEVEGLKLLEYPQYTRPETFEGSKVPDILLSGNHQEIEKWRNTQARKKTQKLRPDLLN